MYFYIGIKLTDHSINYLTSFYREILYWKRYITTTTIITSNIYVNNISAQWVKSFPLLIYTF